MQEYWYLLQNFKKCLPFPCVFFKRKDEILKQGGFQSECIGDSFSCGNETDCRCYLAQLIFQNRLSFQESRSCKKYLSFTQSAADSTQIFRIWSCHNAERVDVYLQGVFPTEPSSLVGFPVSSTKNFAGPNYPDCLPVRGRGHQLFVHLIVDSLHCRKLFIDYPFHESYHVHFLK